MYKNASDKQSFQQRVASHSTKGSRTGRIGDLPSWAQEPEEYYRGLADQLCSLLDELEPIAKECTEIAFRLRSSLPREEYLRLKTKQDALGNKKVLIEERLHVLRPLTRAAALNAWGAVHYLVSEEMLDKETRIKIDAEVKAILQRPIQEFRRQIGEKPDEYKKRHRKRDQVRKARRRLEHTKKTADNLHVRWEKIDGVYRRVVIKDGVRTVSI